jgi:tyrosine-protein kinase Etk/Wzc
MNAERSDMKRVGILDLAIIILERKWLFAAGLLLFCAAGLVTSLCLTKYYAARAVIMKPTQKMPSGLGSLLGKDVPASGLLKTIDILGNDDADNFLSVLTSRRLADSVVRKFDLIHDYGFDNRRRFYYEDVLKTLYRNVDIVENDYGNIEITVTDSNPAHAAAMANFMASQLDTIVCQLSKESARNSRLFFEDRLRIIKGDLDSAGRSLVKFQTDNKYIDLEQQVKSSIEVMAQLEGQKMALDLQIAQMQNQFGTNNRQASELVKQKSVIARKIAGYMDRGGGNLIVSLRNAPEKTVEYGDLMRNVKIQQTLFEFVLQFCEQAKISEANSVPSVQMLEYAVSPQKKIRPKRSIVCLLFLFGGFVAMSTYILVDKWYEIQSRLQTPQYLKIKQTIALLSFRKKTV